MRWGWLGAAALAAGLQFGTACSLFPCFYGVYPYDGQTNVPRDVVITFSAGEVLAADTPDLSPGIGIWRIDQGETGIFVPFHVEVEREAGLVHLLPDAPLAADATYYVSGIDAELVKNRHDQAPLWRDSTAVTFHTGGAPTLLAVYREDEQERAVLVLSEPIDLDALGALTVRDADGQPVAAEIVGLWDDVPWLIEVDDFDDRGTYGERFTVEGLGTRRILEDSYEGTEALRWYGGDATCTAAFDAAPTDTTTWTTRGAR